MTLTEENTLEYGVYTVYDTVLKVHDFPVTLPVSKLDDYYKLVVNDVTSKYYGKESDFILNRIGTFNQESGEIVLHFVERICMLDTFIDKQKRHLQTIVQVLNYLPSGYFKMPDEMKQSIQERIDSATMEYVSKYVIPDLDVSNFDMNKIKDIYKNYDSLTSS